MTEKRENGVGCALPAVFGLAVVWVCLLAAATCETLTAAGGYMVAFTLFLAWTYGFVWMLARKSWGAVLWVMTLGLAVLTCLPDGPQIRMPVYVYCRVRMYDDAARLRAADAYIKSHPRLSDDVFWTLADNGACPQRGRFLSEGQRVFHVCVDVPREDIRAACMVVAHARQENRRETVSLVMPYDEWKAAADGSAWRTPLGLPLVERSERSVAVFWKETPESREYGRAFSAAGLMACVENAVGPDDFKARVLAVEAEETRQHAIYAWRLRALWGVSLAVAYALFLRLVWCRFRAKSGHVPALGEDARWVCWKIGTARRLPGMAENAWRRLGFFEKTVAALYFPVSMVVCMGMLILHPSHEQAFGIIMRVTLWTLWASLLAVSMKRGKVSATAILLLIGILFLLWAEFNFRAM